MSVEQYKLALVSRVSVASAIGRTMTADYAAEQIRNFAEAMNLYFAKADETSQAIATALVIDRFEKDFRPGMQSNADTVVTDALIRAVELAKLVGLVEVPIVEAEEATEGSGEASEELPPSDNLSDAEVSSLVEEVFSENKTDYAKTSVDELPIHGGAKRAFKAAGLLTVGDLETFSELRSLDDVNGVGPEWAADTLEAIKKLKGE